MKLLKWTFSVLSLLVVGVVFFYFWGSSNQMSNDHYYKLITYSSDTPVQKDTLTVMTYNIGYLSGMTNNRPVERPKSLFDTNLKELNALVKGIDPDVIGFQEIDFGSNRSHFVNQLDSVALHGAFYQAYQSINWDKNYVPFPYWPVSLHFRSMLSGQAILSRYEIVNANTEVLVKPMNAPFYYNQFYLDRLLQITQIEINDKSLTVMNVHLEAFDTETREAQAVVVKTIYEIFSNQGPTLLLGDFNSRPPWEQEADEVMKTILSAKNIASAISQNDYLLNPKAHYTFDSEQPYQMIDYILYSPENIELIEARVIQEAGQISDHLPVMMKFIFREENDTIFSE